MNSNLKNIYQPFFSIIIPTYNSAKTISSCLDSIEGQSFHNFEILVIDGCSTDDTLYILAKYAFLANSQIKWISEVDNGIYDAMNKGIKLAKGEWLYFLGSDDRLNNVDVLQKIASLDKKDYNVLYGNTKIIGDTSWAKDSDLYDGNFDLLKLLNKNICHQAIFYNKNCFNQYESNFNIEYKMCADYDFNLRCWAKKSFLYIDIVIADFYGGGATTKNIGDDFFFNNFNNKLVEYFGVDSIVKKFLKPKKSMIFYKFLSINILANKVKLIVRVYVKNLFTKPFKI